jgi:hypothetical protein
MVQIWCLCPGSNRGSQRCKKITEFARRIRSLAPFVTIEYFASGSLEPDTITLHKAVLGKVAVGGTNLGSSEWN